MAEPQIMLALRIPEEISNKISYLMSHTVLGEVSRSQVARKALELGLEQLEQQLNSSAPSQKSVHEELAELKKRVDALEALNQKKSFMRDA